MHMIVHVTRTSSAAQSAASTGGATTAVPAATVVAPQATVYPDVRHRHIAGISQEMNGAVRLLRCAATGRLVKQGVSMTHLHVMWLLEEHGELAMSRLADLLDVSLSNATGLIDRMEERGLIARVRVPDDRRVVHVRLTGAGQTVLDEVQVMREDLTQAILERLDDGQLERLHASLQDFRTAVRAEAETNTGLFEAYHRHANDRAETGRESIR
jgi:MarR family transcriptional regulator, 2-MHQ and catechol-resistance regulon repressor